MGNRARRAVGALLALLATVSLIGCTTSSPAGTPYSPAIASSDPGALSDATLDQMRRISGLETPEIEGVAGDLPGETMQDFKDRISGCLFTVDRDSGQVRYFSNTPVYETRSGPAIDQVDVERIAAEFAARIYDRTRLSGAEPTIEFVDHGDSYHYEIRFDERIGEVRTFNYLHLTYRQDGELLNCALQDLDVTASLDPVLSRQEALDAVTAQPHWEEWTSATVELVVVREAGGEQRLCWSVVLENAAGGFGGNGYSCLVDAVSGAVSDAATH